ncbi:hypothetical protein LXL04_016382 [Taraxacum kok-saghyz]
MPQSTTNRRRHWIICCIKEMDPPTYFVCVIDSLVIYSLPFIHSFQKRDLVQLRPPIEQSTASSACETFRLSNQRRQATQLYPSQSAFTFSAIESSGRSIISETSFQSNPKSMEVVCDFNFGFKLGFDSISLEEEAAEFVHKSDQEDKVKQFMLIYMRLKSKMQDLSVSPLVKSGIPGISNPENDDEDGSEEVFFEEDARGCSEDDPDPVESDEYKIRSETHQATLHRNDAHRKERLMIELASCCQNILASDTNFHSECEHHISKSEHHVLLEHNSEFDTSEDFEE